MTAGSAESALAVFGRHLLAERTRLLAGRGQAEGDGAAAALPVRLVCAAGPRLVALAPGLIGHVRVTAFHPLPLIRPAAAHAMLGAFMHNGLLHSLVELSRLLAPDGPAAPGGAGGGRMLLLHGAERRRVALRVDEVLGMPALRPAGDDRHALLPDDRLAILLDGDALRAALDALDEPAAPAVAAAT